MGWTTQQQTAIDARGCGLIVSAAAGSGKTSVLVERLTEIIADRRSPVPVEKMIIVTFTKDAAAEIRQRLSASLERAIAAAPEDTWLRRQQMLLPSAKIATINAFCFDIIREHMGDGEITSAFRVLDDSEQEILTLKAADEAIVIGVFALAVNLVYKQPFHPRVTLATGVASEVYPLGKIINATDTYLELVKACL